MKFDLAKLMFDALNENKKILKKSKEEQPWSVEAIRNTVKTFFNFNNIIYNYIGHKQDEGSKNIRVFFENKRKIDQEYTERSMSNEISDAIKGIIISGGDWSRKYRVINENYEIKEGLKYKQLKSFDLIIKYTAGPSKYVDHIAHFNFRGVEKLTITLDFESKINEHLTEFKQEDKNKPISSTVTFVDKRYIEGDNELAIARSLQDISPPKSPKMRIYVYERKRKDKNEYVPIEENVLVPWSSESFKKYKYDLYYKDKEVWVVTPVGKRAKIKNYAKGYVHNVNFDEGVTIEGSKELKIENRKFLLKRISNYIIKKLMDYTDDGLNIIKGADIVIFLEDNHSKIKVSPRYMQGLMTKQKNKLDVDWFKNLIRGKYEDEIDTTTIRKEIFDFIIETKKYFDPNMETDF